MKIVAALDSFKGSLTSKEAGEAVASGIRRVCPEATVTVCAVADGGEGTAEALIDAVGAQRRTVCVTDAVGQPCEAVYGVSADGKTAYMEMAQAAGLPQVPPSQRDPMHTTTYGVGEMIADAVRNGCRHIVMGIGGSATNDGGIGMLQALGFGLFDACGDPVPFGAKGLEHLSRITQENVIAGLADCRFSVACDVTNPLCGEVGCSKVFAPQKGADEAAVLLMDEWLKRYAALVKTVYPEANETASGVGAAGGLGFALAVFLNATLKSGIALVMEESGIAAEIADADLVITGEGRLDEQSAMGKTPGGIAVQAKKYGIPVVALAGGVSANASACHQVGIDAYFSVTQGACTLEDAMTPTVAARNVAATAEQVMRLFCAVK